MRSRAEKSHLTNYLVKAGAVRPVRCCPGRAVEFKDRVTILDEPTNHLSVREREQVNEIAQQLREQGLLVIYIAHDILQVHRIADRVVIMQNGENVADLKKDEMTADELEHIIRDGGRQMAEAAA
jgi:simple sugar transport system ATP-binding protein